MKLTQDQIQILRNGKIEENRFLLQGQLDRKQYTDINKVLETIGLKWNRWKKAHISELSQEELTQALDYIFETGEVETLQETIKKFQFYPTPKEVAEYLVELADIKLTDYVLEPSAWLWSIVDEIVKKDFKMLNLVELDKNKYEILREREITNKLHCSNCDFLDFRSKSLIDSYIWDKDDLKFNKIIANPPFSKSQDIKHILYMYELLKDGGRIVSVASSSIQWREGKLYDELRSLNPEFIELPEWSFQGSWTMVNTIIVVINK